ncbi:hypothetical protein ACFRMN_25600 [Streptomyces sp. NPDC056835]|uniref:hypothetical protein n=1 Tax=Streptomyces sp. NPDC056835 TaxID=3345956 RepID=UPI003684BA4D
MTDDEVSRRLKLVGGARLDGDRIAVSAMLFKGPVHLSTEEVSLSIDDASVLQAVAPDRQGDACEPFRP